MHAKIGGSDPEDLSIWIHQIPNDKAAEFAAPKVSSGFMKIFLEIEVIFQVDICVYKSAVM